MLNLLPKDYKNKVRGEYVMRFYSVSCMLFSFLSIFFLVAMFPSYTLVNTKKNIAEQASKSIKGSVKAGDRDVVLPNIKDLETRLKVVAQVPGEKPTDYIDKALELKGDSVSISNITYTKTADSKKQVILQGEALSRTSLINFSKRVKASDWTITTDIPLSNLANDKNIPFSINLTATSTSR